MLPKKNIWSSYGGNGWVLPIGQVYEKRKKGGWRVWEILKRGAIGRWVGEVRGGMGVSGNTKEGEVVKE